jgi:hypothetical protein
MNACELGKGEIGFLVCYATMKSVLEILNAQGRRWCGGSSRFAQSLMQHAPIALVGTPETHRHHLTGIKAHSAFRFCEQGAHGSPSSSNPGIRAKGFRHSRFEARFLHLRSPAPNLPG